MLSLSQRLFFAAWLLWWGIGLAPSAVAHGDLHDRIIALSFQLATNQTAPELWLRRADLHRQHGDFAAARYDLAHAASLRPGWPAVSLQRARLAFDEQDFTGCVAAAGTCLQREPANADALVLRARAHVRLQELEPAIADYTAVLAETNLSLSLPDLYRERAQAQAASRHWADAVRGLDEGIARLGLTPALVLPAIEYERQRGAFAAALQRLERARNFFDAPTYEQWRADIQKELRKT